MSYVHLFMSYAQKNKTLKQAVPLILKTNVQEDIKSTDKGDRYIRDEKTSLKRFLTLENRNFMKWMHKGNNISN